MPKFEVGEVVYLNSGGPKMTVEEVKENECNCTWFNKYGKLISQWFKETTIHSIPRT